MTISSSEIKRNMTILLEGEIVQVLEWNHRQAPKAPPTLTLKVRHLGTGSVFEKKIAGNHKLTLAYTETRNCQYLYRDNNLYNFMDNETFEQFPVEESLVKHALSYIPEGGSVDFRFYNDKPLIVELPSAVTLTIEKTERGLRGDSQGSATKPAITNTGLNIQVPLFINENDRVNVKTDTGEYLGRAD